MKIAIAATFTAEPLQDSLAFWADKLHWQAEFAFASYNQVFQELLDPTSLLSTNRSGFNIVLIRSEDWRKQEVETPTIQPRGSIFDHADQFVRAVMSALQRSTTPCLICLCPASPQNAADVYIQQAEELISDNLKRCPGVHVIRSAEVRAMYPVREYYDANRDQLGHVPYTNEFFAALGSVLMRRIRALKRNPYKVIVSDCDETLWKGVCAEVGPQGVEIDAGHRALQEFLVRKQTQGMLLCLCSKNIEADLDEVFRCRPMPLKPEHIIARRVNWQPKPQNVRELAAELQLGLDSFIFIDDNPLECEQMRSECPEVLTLQLPVSEDISHFLGNVWPFDKHEFTEEDRRRTALYRENQERDRFRQQAPTLESFLASLQLEINIARPSPAQMPRVAQLTQRTNQFNFTNVRRTEAQMAQLLQSGESDCLAVHVKDRFGDYGLVGATILSSSADALRVDTFLLSCRVLGRGVEHAMLRHLGDVAVSRRLSRVDLEFVPTKRNAPALAFLDSVVADFKEPAQSGFVFRVPARYAAEICRSKMLGTAQAAAAAVTNADGKSSEKPPLAADSELIQEIAAGLDDVPSILQAIRKYKGVSQPQPIPIQDSLQDSYVQVVTDSWCEVLSQATIRPHDDFFALGGDSLLATQVISRLRQTCGVRLHLSDLFDNATVEGLAKIIQNKKTDISKRASVTVAIAQPSRGIPRREAQTPCALSFSQQRWWFLNQWAPGTADHLSLVLRLKGVLKREALELSLQRLIERHEILRTSYRLVEGSPVQVVSPTLYVPLSFVSLSDVPAPEQESEAEKFFDRQFRQPFDLSNDPPLRATLLQYAPEDHVLVLVMHHIASDGWSRGILLREFETAYQAYVCGQEPAFSDLPIQYSDFSLWQRSHFADGTLEDQISYWQEHLAGVPALLQLPTDYPRPTLPSLREGIHTRVLSHSVLSQLLAFGQSEGATLFMTLLAAFQALLYRYTGQQDVVVGSPVAGRNHLDLAGVIGCFINMVAFRSRVEGNTTFRQFLAQVRKVALEAEERQEVPFEKLVEELERRRDMSRAPIFQAVLALENLLSTPHLPGLDVQLQEVETRSAFHDLSLFAAQQADGLRLRFEYRTDLFMSTTIERLADHFTNLLMSIVADPDQAINSLSILGEDELHKLLVTWNETRVEYPRDIPLHRFIEEQVERTPSAPAVIYEGETLSYAQLNARANQLAHHLQKFGVGPDTLVGVCAERSQEMVIALLGTMKAGAAYVPFDPEFPRDRLASMLEDAKPPVLLTQAALRDRIASDASAVICLDSDWPQIATESDTNLCVPVSGKNLAYAIYTSGSTGKPKGVLNVHEAIVNRLLWMQDSYGLTPADRVLQKTSYNFDVSVWEFFWPLMTGATLVIARPGGHKDPVYLANLIAAEKVTTIHFVPSMLRIFLEVDEVAHCTSLRQVFASGEALTFEVQRRFFQRLQAELHNLYGPTEAAVDVTYWACRPDYARTSIPIGRPISNIEIYILDSQMQPVPIGVTGELHIGGIGLARGYLNRPELTAQKFIPNPHRLGDRLYKTGDLARFRPDGNVEYLGRIDHQVKLRGFRIELGEIENSLAQHAGIRQAIVMLREDQPGDKRLVAYVVRTPGEAPETGDLLTFLRQTLPEYMIPAAIVPLESLPLNPNGKIDRSALPAPQMGLATGEAEYIAPRTPLEQEVAAAWTQVLGRDRISIADNLFEIGGHSLLATRITMLLRERLGLSLPLRVVFQNTSIAGMAYALLESLLEHADEEEAIRIVDEVEALSNEDAQEQRKSLIAAENNLQRAEFLSAALP